MIFILSVAKSSKVNPATIEQLNYICFMNAGKMVLSL